jgi:disulfide bond formation protein DsbB
MAIPNSRIIFLVVFLGCAFLMAVALYMEHAMGLEPCPMCIMQRVMVIATALVALVAAIHGPGETGIRVYGAISIATAASGGGISMRQLWLQSLPEDQVPACGPGLDYLIDVFPLTEVLTMVLSGDGTCAEVAWEFLGLSIPGWTLVGFIGLIAIGLFQVMRPKIAN